MYLDYKEHKAGVYVIDIETESLHPKILHVMCWRNLLTAETGEAKGVEEAREFFEGKDDAFFIGHNILQFDGPVLNRLVGTNLSAKNCMDTLVLSTLYRPSLSGGHSLDAWGERLGEPKIEFNDWTKLTDEMIEYCHQDVLVTAKLFVKLIRTLAKIGFSERSIWLQHNLQEIIDKQKRTGFQFDGPRALELYTKLRQEETDLQDEIRKAFPPTRTQIATRSLRKKSGEYTSIYLRDRDRYIIDVRESDGVYDAYIDVEFNLGSPKQRVDKLLSLGWEPQEFTPKGFPKPFDKGKLAPSLEKFLEEHEVPEVKLIARWMTVNGRANMINTWLENWNENDGKIHGKLFVADTLRFRHQAPNTANIPAVRIGGSGNPLFGQAGDYTYEARDLWTARPGRVLVGTDAAGLELRMLAHFLRREDFTDSVVNGDPHQYNADLVGITRPQAKTLIYATLYGAGPPKIAKTLGISVKEGAQIRHAFLETLGLSELLERCKNEFRKGRIELVDGSLVVCPSEHAALNYKLQGSGARVMGLGSVLLERAIQNQELDSLKVGDIHDEWQYDVHPEDADEHAEAAVKAIRQSGNRLRLSVPLDGESKKGLTWAETH